MILALLAALVALADPALPPDVPADFTYAVPGVPGEAPWWDTWGDPGLADVVTRALEGNGDLGALEARLRQAEALSRQAASPLMPSVGLDFGASTSPRSVRCAQLAAQIGGGDGEDGGFVSMIECDDEGWFVSGSGTVGATWAIDLFGANTLTWQASRHDARASAGDLDAQRIAMATRAANAWYDLEATRAQLALLQEQVDANLRLLELVELRHEAGEASAAEVMQQRQQLAAARARLPEAAARARSAEAQLLVLLGEQRGPLEGGSGALPSLPPPPPTGRPEDLPAARPDLRASASQLDAAEARRRAAVMGALPDLGVSASAGYQTFELSKDDPFVEAASVGASLSVPLFQGGRQASAVQAARAAEDIARSSFEQALRQAVFEVDDARQRELAQAEVVALLVEQESWARGAFDDLLLRYEAGLARYVDVLVALNAWQQARISLLSGQRELIRARIDLHDALGGAWASTF